MNYSEGETKILTFGLLAITVFIGIYAIGRYQKNVQEANHVAYCVSGYTGEDESKRDWTYLLKMDARSISSETGINQNVIEDCTRP